MKRILFHFIPTRGIYALKKSLFAGVLTVAYICFASFMANAMTLPESITTIEESAFEGNPALTEVTLPENILIVNANAFADCENLIKIVVQNKSAALAPLSLGGEGAAHAIYGYKNSTAQTYADVYGIDFHYLDEDTGEPDETPAKIRKLLEYADSLLGSSYSSMDCVGFVSRCYRNALGITTGNTCYRIYHNSYGAKGTRIDKISDMKPGDIICWMDDNDNDDDLTDCEHVGLYVGEGTLNGVHYNSGVFIESSRGAGKVRYNYIPATGSSYYTRNFLCAWRLVE